MKSVSLNNSELEVIADSLEKYPYLHSLDISENRLEGMQAGKAIAQILLRRPDEARNGH